MPGRGATYSEEDIDLFFETLETLIPFKVTKKHFKELCRKLEKIKLLQGKKNLFNMNLPLSTTDVDLLGKRLLVFFHTLLNSPDAYNSGPSLKQQLARNVIIKNDEAFDLTEETSHTLQSDTETTTQVDDQNIPPTELVNNEEKTNSVIEVESKVDQCSHSSTLTKNKRKRRSIEVEEIQDFIINVLKENRPVINITIDSSFLQGLSQKTE